MDIFKNSKVLIKYKNTLNEYYLEMDEFFRKKIEISNYCDRNKDKIIKIELQFIDNKIKDLKKDFESNKNEIYKLLVIKDNLEIQLDGKRRL